MQEKIESKTCAHSLRIYEEDALPLLKWKCVACERTGTRADKNVKFLHKMKDIKKLINEKVV